MHGQLRVSSYSHVTITHMQVAQTYGQQASQPPARQN